MHSLSWAIGSPRQPDCRSTGQGRSNMTVPSDTQHQPTIALAQEFLGALSNIPRAKQNKVQDLIGKFRSTPRSSGINYEIIRDARDKNMRSVRVDQEYRAIVLKPEKGNVYVFMWVDKHDDAYDWARRHEASINPRTGSLQVLATVTREVYEDAPESSPLTAPVNESSSPLFDDVRDRELLRLGVPEALLERVRELKSSSALDAMQFVLPDEAYEALLFLAQGEDKQEILEMYGAPDEAPSIDTEDFVQALLQADSQRRFHVVEDDDELTRMLNAPLEHWRVFLHPSQRELVERDWNGAVRVLGGAGTGKTVVAMHRARYLARHAVRRGESNERSILFTTFTRNLAQDIEQQLNQLCTRQEMACIEVINIDRLIHRLTSGQGKARLAYSNQAGYRKAWRAALQLIPDELDLPESFYDEEWQQVVLPQHARTRQEYFRARRVGRGKPLNRGQRAAIWPVFEEMRNQLNNAGLRTIEDCTFDAVQLAEQGQLTRQYRHVIADEIQDFGAESLKLLRALVPEGANDLFLVGDGHQRIYGRRATLSSCGINVRGRRGRKLRINYRTTEQTRRYAVALLEGVEVDDLDDGQDSSSDYRSLLQGEAPSVQHFDSFDEEVDALVQLLEGLDKEPDREAGDGQRPTLRRDCCIVARTQRLRDQYAQALKARGIPVAIMEKESGDEATDNAVRLATMHRVKGLEFRKVCLAGINAGVVPAPRSMDSEDPVEKRYRELNERALVHVAATRAIESLHVSSFGEPSPYLTSANQ
ncbi:UvrD-helicase domain-containing protein [Cobetia marina]|uniref:DNA 3'-5' helicase n=1 Tax=Cobetia marina TaxID=28258 RepID=A0ABU9GE17_COBMA